MKLYAVSGVLKVPVTVPEPSTFTLFVTSLAGLGFMMRRRRSMQLEAAKRLPRADPVERA